MTELLVVIAILALLVGFGAGGAKQILKTFTSGGDPKYVIEVALVRARSIAASKGVEAGVRFQRDYKSGKQYMIYIIYDPDASPNGTGLVNGFRAVGGLVPVALPEGVGVTDLRVRTDLVNADVVDDVVIDSDLLVNDDFEVTDTTTFSIIFSPLGKLVIRDVRVRNEDGKTEGSETFTSSNDEIFNTETKITRAVLPYGQFLQDDYAGYGLGEESSRNSFFIFDENEFNAVGSGSRFSGYLSGLSKVFVTQYTGELID